ncbi:hypothetical protein HETIRDRAFT_118568 [Heterobasidion irregulare TC 32-1]|uniref:Retrotransposon gag domain-containing protein n=1 Tax=Heterobasidion irregulare (strain TC 32-1) TaxID=747525 RepID=W4JWB1_HETIT|nr:uncharacterized protein HETIRDRAFT_118568 [Heterobasidion irregulare TC 32-1]ETW77176.1 hypothetical protein HETIRDRAFT_118568 [Heterobasidion irregulare TC 32-1]
MPAASPIQETSPQASFQTPSSVESPQEEHTQEPDTSGEPPNDKQPLTSEMLTNTGNPGSKGPAMAKPTPFDRNQKRTEQFLHEIDIMILARKHDFPDEFTKIAYALSYMKRGSAGIWSRNFTKARNLNDNWDLYTWKPTQDMTSVHQKISADFEESDKTADARDKLARINQGKESFNAYLQLFEQIAELAGVDLETKKTHFLRGLK